MKLVIQIPCYNEVGELRRTVEDIPRNIQGFDSVELLVIDDGSTDGTAELARELEVDHVVRLEQNTGLANAFRIGVDHALAAGADVIVHTDDDNQYPARYIPALVAPVLSGEADFVIGDRQVHEGDHYSAHKKWLHRIGTWVIQRCSGLNVHDPVCGFRAFTREAALKIAILSDFSYTIEMLIQAGEKKLRVVQLPIEVNPTARPSRLFTSNFQFVRLSILAIVRTTMFFKPLRFFLPAGLLFCLIGTLPILRFVYFYMEGMGDGKIQSLVIGSSIFLTGVILIFFGLLADMISSQQKQLDQIHERIRQIQLRD